jgi:hypothetical protein
MTVRIMLLSSLSNKLIMKFNDMFFHHCFDIDNDFSSSLIQSFNVFDLQ